MAFPWNDATRARIVTLREREFHTWSEIARLIGADSPSVPRTEYSRYKQREHAGALETPAAAPEAPLGGAYEVQSQITTHDFFFDGENYYFPINGKNVRFPKAVWEDIVASYSAEGGDQVRAQIARKIGMHRKVLDIALRQYGQYKTSAPVTKEALADAAQTGDFEPLYDKAIEVVEGRFIGRLQQRRHAHVLAENERLKTQINDQAAVLAAAREAARSVADDFPAPVAFPTGRPAGTTLFVPFYDQHLGAKTVPGTGWGRGYSTAVATHRVRVMGGEVLAYLQEQPGVSDVLLLIGGDLFHAMLQRTKKGTPLERDLPDRLVFRAAFAVFRDLIEAVRGQGVRVKLLVIPGNHDHIFVEMLEEMLWAYYQGLADLGVDFGVTVDLGVTVPNLPGKRKWHLEGETLHVFDHGEGFERLAWQQFTQAELIARMTGHPFVQASRIVLWVGHTHHLEMKAHGAHLEVVRVPHAAETNEYEEGLMHSGEPQGLFAHFDRQGRVRSFQRVYFRDYPHPEEFGGILDAAA